MASQINVTFSSDSQFKITVRAESNHKPNHTDAKMAKNRQKTETI